MTIRQDKVAVEGAGELTFNYLESHGAVGVVPVTPDGRIILIRQYRYTVDDWLLEIPAGGMHDANGAMPEEMALLELREEAGGRCEVIEYVGCFYASVGNSSQPFYVFLALGVELSEPQGLQPGERIEIVPTRIAEALQLAREGEIKDGVSALSVLMCESRLREHGYL
jgi:ADP-ribose pyrophosphatase